jgi:hypothetical protein
MQVGFAESDFAIPSGRQLSSKSSTATLGVGDKGTTGRSWAYDGRSGNKCYNGASSYGASYTWQAGDVVGCLLDLDAGKIAFTLNDIELGVAFVEVKACKTNAILPMASLKGGMHMFRLKGCSYLPSGYKEFEAARNERIETSQTALEADVHNVLLKQAASHGQAWRRVEMFLKDYTPKDLVKAQVMFVRDGKIGIVQWADGNGEYVVKFDGEDDGNPEQLEDDDLSMMDSMMQSTSGGEKMMQSSENRTEKIQFGEHHDILVGPPRQLMKDSKFPYTTSFVTERYDDALERMKQARKEEALLAQKIFKVSFTRVNEKRAKKLIQNEETAEGQSKGKKKKLNPKQKERLEALAKEEAQKIKDIATLSEILFHQLDADGGEEISKEELKRLQAIRGVRLSDRDIEVANKAMDEDGSGDISYGEFEIWFRSDHDVAQRLREQVSLAMLEETDGRVTLALINGDVLKLGGHVTDMATWDTVRACKGAVGGKWYFEVQIGTHSPARIGLMTTDYAISEGDDRFGVGNEMDSGEAWAFDGSKQTIYHHGELPYAAHVQWQAGDSIGCRLDLHAGTIAFTQNGVYLGVAYRAVAVPDGAMIFPAATLEGGPHQFCFSRHECRYAPDGFRLWGNAEMVDVVDDEKETKNRRRAFFKARRLSEQNDSVWASPKGLEGRLLEGRRIKMKERGTGKVAAFNANGKHAIDFDDRSKLTTLLDSRVKFDVLSPVAASRIVNTSMARREQQLFDQRWKLAGRPLEGDTTELPEELLEDERGGQIWMEIFGEFDDDDEHEDLEMYGEAALTATNDDQQNPDAEEDSKSPNAEDMDKAGDEDADGSVGEDEDKAESENQDIAGLFEVLAQAQAVEVKFEEEARNLAFKQEFVWEFPTGSELLDNPNGLIGQTVRSTQVGSFGEVVDYTPGKRGAHGKHSIDFGGKSGVKKLQVDMKRLNTGDVKILNLEFVEDFVRSYVEEAVDQWAQDNKDRLQAEKQSRLKAIRKQRRQESAKKKASAFKHATKAGSSFGLKGIKAVLKATLAATEIGLSGTSAVTKTAAGILERPEEEHDYDLDDHDDPGELIGQARAMLTDEARLRGFRMPEAWVEGNTLNAKTGIVEGLLVNVEHHGKGTVLSKAGKEWLVDFEIGGKEKLPLKYKERPFTAVNFAFVNVYVDEEEQKFEQQVAAIIEDATLAAIAELTLLPDAWRVGDNTLGKDLIGHTIRIRQEGAEDQAQARAAPPSSPNPSSPPTSPNSEDFEEVAEAKKPKKGQTFKSEQMKFDEAFDAPGKIYVRGTVEDFKKNRYIIKIDGQDGLEKSKLTDEFYVFNDDYVSKNAIPIVRDAVAPWAEQKLKLMDIEREDIEAEMEKEKEVELQEYIKDKNRRDLSDAAATAAYYAKVQLSAYESFCKLATPEFEQMGPESLEAAGGLQTLLQQKWIQMSRDARKKHENKARKSLGITAIDGLGEQDGPALAEYRVLKEIVVRKELEAKSEKKGKLRVGDTVQAFETRAGADGVTSIRCDRGWVSLTQNAKKGRREKLLVSAGIAVPHGYHDKRINARKLNILSPTGGMSEEEFQQCITEALEEMEITNRHDGFVHLDVFVKWFASGSSPANAVKQAVVDLGWPELASLEVYVDPTTVTEEEVAEKKSELMDAAKRFATMSTGGLRAAYKASKTTRRITRDVTGAVTKLTADVTGGLAQAAAKAGALMEAGEAAAELSDAEQRGNRVSELFGILDPDGDRKYPFKTHLMY